MHHLHEKPSWWMAGPDGFWPEGGWLDLVKKPF